MLKRLSKSVIKDMPIPQPKELVTKEQLLQFYIETGLAADRNEAEKYFNGDDLNIFSKKAWFGIILWLLFAWPLPASLLELNIPIPCNFESVIIMMCLWALSIPIFTFSVDLLDKPKWKELGRRRGSPAFGKKNCFYFDRCQSLENGSQTGKTDGAQP